MTKRLSPATLKRRRRAYWRACLRRDQNPADPVVLQIFQRLQWARKCRPSGQHYPSDSERKEWKQLIHYFTTLEDARSLDLD